MARLVTIISDAPRQQHNDLCDAARVRCPMNTRQTSPGILPPCRVGNSRDTAGIAVVSASPAVKIPGDSFVSRIYGTPH